MECPKCGYVMDDLTNECPRCARMAQAPTPPPSAAPPLTPQPYAVAPGYATAGGYDPPRTSGLATASLICGLAGLCTFGVSSLVGLMLGIIAALQINNNPRELKGMGLAVSGMIVSLVIMLGAISFAIFSYHTARTVMSSKQGKMGMAIGLQQSLNQAVIRFHTDTGVYPDTLSDLGAAKESELKTKVPAGSYHGPYAKAVPGFLDPIDGTDIIANPLVDKHDPVIEHHWIYDKTTGTVKSAVPIRQTPSVPVSSGK